ncbi:hypothetical protein Tco_0106334 [Tanacetum coccineum]
MSWSNIAGGKNRLTKACLISSQVVITPGLSSLNQILASPAMDDGKSFNLMASMLVLPYRNSLHISTNLAIGVVSKVNRDNSGMGWSSAIGKGRSRNRLNVEPRDNGITRSKS